MEKGGEVGGGRAEGSLAVGDGGQAAISLTPDADGTGSDSLLGPDAHCIFESSQFEGSSVGELRY